MRRRVVLRSLVVILYLLVAAALGVMALRPRVLTQLHQDEMRAALQHYYATLFSIKGQSDPQVIASFAENDYRDYLLGIRCITCPSIQVARRLSVVELQVLEYSSTAAKVYARVEYGWNKVDPATGQVIDRCHAQAFSASVTWVRQDGLWKVSGGDDINANRLDDSPYLIAQYCDND